MVESPGPVPSHRGDLLSSFDWLIESAIPAPDPGRFSRASLVQLGRAAVRWARSQTLDRTTLLYMLGLIALAAIVASLVWQSPDASLRQPAKAPSPPRIESPFAPGTMRTLSRNEAIAWNAASDAAPTPSAASFVLESPAPTDYQRSVECLAQAIHYEAATEGVDGGRAVAQVVLNRVRHPAYPDTICGVVYEGAKRTTGCQFTFACDGSLARVPTAAAWRRARAIAISALSGDVYAPVGWATHYHANYVVPYWAASLEKTASVGAHIFYRWTGNWGEARAFTRRYAGNEPLAALLLGEQPVTTDAAAIGQAAVMHPSEPVAEARPVLIAPAPGSATDDAVRPRARQVELGDRQVLLPRTGGSIEHESSVLASER